MNGTIRIFARPTPLRWAAFARMALTLALLTSVASEALAQGSISGRVTGSDAPGGLANIGVQVYDLVGDTDGPFASTTTDGSGNYTFTSLPASTYAVLTQAKQGYINEIWNGVSCSAVCDTNIITTIDITTNAVTGIDFVLEPGGGRIAGTVTDASTGLGIANVTLLFADGGGNVAFTSATTDSSGNYLSDGGTVTGTVFVFTQNSLGYINEAYDDCTTDNCEDPVSVTLGATTNGINFALVQGGRISGHVEDSSHSPLANVEINFSDSTGSGFDSVFTDASGNFSSSGLPSGTYYVSTRNPVGLVDLLWNNTLCAGGFCNPANGTPITVTAPATTSGINFVLPPGATISGTVTNFADGAPILNANVSISNAAGAFVAGVNVDNSGAYTTGALPTGTYFATVFNASGFVGQQYNNISCGNNCVSTNGTKIVVVANNPVTNINFSMLATGTGTITGTVTDATGAPVPVNNLQVLLVSTTNGSVANVNTNASGVYTFSNVAAGSYYLRTNASGSLIGHLINKLYPNVTCIGCSVLTTPGGTLVTVRNGVTTSNIDFALVSGGRISGTVLTGPPPGSGSSGIPVQVFNSAGVQTGSFTTASGGGYTTSGLPAGTYYLRTSTNLHVNVLYNNISCPLTSCSVTTGTPVVVTVGATTPGIDFLLPSSGQFSGTVTDALTSTGIGNLTVQIFSSAGLLLGTANTANPTGNFTTGGLPAGTYYARTNSSPVFQNNTTVAYVDELWDNTTCVPACQNPTLGTPITVTLLTTTTGVNFALQQGGMVSGAVTDASAPGVGLGSIGVQIYTASGALAKTTSTNAAGGYTVAGLPAANYFARTAVPGTAFYQDELYSEIPCGTGCTVTDGAAIAVVGVSTANSVDFTLPPGAGAISGTVTDAGTAAGVSVTVQVFNSSGVIVKSVGSSAGTGAYTASGLAPGTYYVRTSAGGAAFYLDELWSEISCSPTCTVTSGTGVTVTSGSTTTGVNFTLTSGAGSISGTITDAGTSNPIAGEAVQIYTSGGTFVKSVTTNGGGAYLVGGLSEGTYYARTAVSAGSTYADELYNNISCSPSCNVTSGTAIVVTAGATQSGVNFTLIVRPAVDTLTATPSALRFGATKSGATLTQQTPAQIVTVNIAGASPSWSASADQPWIQINGGSGTGSGQMAVGIINPSDVIGSSTSLTGNVTVTGGTLTAIVTVTLTVQQSGSGSAPFGSFDSPTNGATGITGSIAVTGWSLDDVGVTQVKLWRNCVDAIDRPVGACFAAVSGGPANFVFIGNGVFLSGARPDVEAAFPTHPQGYRAGWGYLMMTNALPNIPAGTAQGGQGTFTLSAYANDAAGFSTLLGTKTITLNNDNATIPFGAIDTPDQGATVTANIYAENGWSMTQNPKCIDTTSTASYRVYIDGVSLTLTPGANWFPGQDRPDIAGAFPGRCNTNNALATYYIDVTALGLSNGLHTTGWDVIDNGSNIAGIGSRFFNLLVGSSLVSSDTLTDRPAVLAPASALDSLALADRTVLAHAGPGDGPFDRLEADSAHRYSVQIPAGGRVAIDLGGPVEAGYQEVVGELRALPGGSTFSADAGQFAWQPPAPYLGSFHLVFTSNGERIDIDATIVDTTAPRQVHVQIDTPAANADVSGSFVVAGWAVDTAAQTGSGIDTLHVWAYKRDGIAEPEFLGAAAVGGIRPDVAAAMGNQFGSSGFTLTASGLAPGIYDLLVYPWSHRTGRFEEAQTVRVRVR